MLILIPGANVATSYYVDTAKAIQEQTFKISLWVVVPSVTAEKCIILCPSTKFCSPLHYVVTKAVEKAEAMGFPKDLKSKPFLAGHSLGGVCASTLASAYADENSYDSLVVMGSYVTNQDVANFPLPVLTLGAQLDGGLGRPGMLTRSLTSALSISKDYDVVLKNKPVVILPKLDHSSFCPGFQVPGDVFPADIDDKIAVGMIGSVVAAFLHIRVEQHSSDDLDVLRDAMTYTKNDMLKPYFDALALEHTDTTTPWCVEAQMYLSGLGDEDVKRLKIQNGAQFYSDSHQFEHSRVAYVRSSNGNLLLNVSGHTDEYKGGLTDLGDSCLVPAHDVACKLASADRIAQQLNITNYVSNRTCGDVSRLAVKKARELLSQTTAGKSILETYDRRQGRPICYEPDTHALFNIGPIFISETIKIEDNGKCLDITSLGLGPQPLNSAIFPGVYYCKVLSPARVIDYIMTDSLKPKSGCLNK
jgi:hypothetical protein